MSTSLRPALAAALGIVLISGCSGDRPKLRGAGCEVNSDCDAPLVCRLTRCRKECGDHRDCGLGLQCLVDEDGLGACQLEDELECLLDSECPDVLVCRGGECVNECAVDRDCPPDSECRAEGGEDLSCQIIQGAESPCVYNSDCPAPQICDDDQRCRLECTDDRDCVEPRVCVAMRCVLGDGGP